MINFIICNQKKSFFNILNAQLIRIKGLISPKCKFIDILVKFQHINHFNKINVFSILTQFFKHRIYNITQVNKLLKNIQNKKMRKIINFSLNRVRISQKNIGQNNMHMRRSFFVKSISNVNFNRINYVNSYAFASSNKSQQPIISEQQSAQVIVPYKGYLSVRNSQNMELTFQTIDNKYITSYINKNSTIQDIKNQLLQKLNAKDVQILCDQGKLISDLTPFQALLDRYFFVLLNGDYSVKVQGQLSMKNNKKQQIQDFQNLQLPLLTRRDISRYMGRINSWIQAKYGAGFQSTSIKIPKNQAKKIIIQALMDPTESTKDMLKKQQQFQKLYWEVQSLLDKKNEAAIQCSKMVRNRMGLGLFLILGNVGFIWSGTYIYYSWDIIQPIAYFISSMAGIILCSRFFKIKRPFSLMNYKQYMINKYMPKAIQKVGLDIKQLQIKQRILLELQSQIKDYYLRKL